MIMGNEKEYKIPAEGSLGLLALGDIGLKLWREKRHAEGKDPKPRKKKPKQNKESDGEEAGK